MTATTPIRARRELSIRTHILLIVLVGAILPLALVGLWLTRGAVRSGEELLQSQLEASAAGLADAVRARWHYRKGDLLLLSDNEVARRVLSAGTASAADSLFLGQLAFDVARTIPLFEYRDSGGRVRWASGADAAGRGGDPSPTSRAAIASTGPTIAVRLPVQRVSDSGPAGELDARVRLDGVLPSDSGRSAVPGSSLGVRDLGSGAILIPLAHGLSFSSATQVAIAGVPWRVARRTLDEPPLELVLAAPTAAYVTPFEGAGQVGLGAVVLVTVAAVVLSFFLTARLARSLQGAADVAHAVSQGELDRRLDPGGPREIAVLAAAFNTMTDSLRRTMEELSRRSALAAVGEFAASLAHEIRNALTSVKVDLQRAEQKLPPDSPSRDLVSRTLLSVTRLNATVTGALRMARSGTVEPQPVDLGTVLSAAAENAQAAFAATASTVELNGIAKTPLWVSGDPDALEQLFLNLLLNAGQALRDGGRAQVTAAVNDGHVVVSIVDSGVGMSAQQLEHAVEPFFTTRPGGTGLGLPIARQIAVAHGGDITIESEPGRGTTVRVELPRRA